LSKALSIPLREFRAAYPDSRKPTFVDVRKRFVPWKPFRIAKDRPTRVRYRASRSRYPKLMERFERNIGRRHDLPWVKLYLREACFDSYLELIFSLHLLEAGAQPGWCAPQLMGFTTLPVVDPRDRDIVGHRSRPSLLFNGWLFFPQVSVLTRKRIMRLDLLAGRRLRNSVYWLDVEVDGEGHDPNEDWVRTSELPFPIHRVQTRKVVSGEFLSYFRTDRATAA